MRCGARESRAGRRLHPAALEGSAGILRVGDLFIRGSPTPAGGGAPGLREGEREAEKASGHFSLGLSPRQKCGRKVSMKIKFSDLWRWDGTVDRGPYALIGVVGFALKHNMDRALATLVFHRRWE